MKILYALMLFACAGSPAIVPADRRIDTEAGGLSLHADPSAWHGSPYDLNRYAVPLQITVTNNSSEPVMLNTSDFVLSQRLYQFTFRMERLEPRPDNGDKPVYAEKPGRTPGDTAYRARAPNPTQLNPLYPTNERYAWQKEGPFYVYHGPRIYFADPIPSYDTPQDFFMVAQPAPKTDIKPLALADGPLAPGESRTGFVYFARPDARARTVTLSWTPQVAGVRQAPLHISFKPT